ncbi:ABC-2 type transporter-domain-containing protein [Paraphoma chrysanthemicola]|nr:ABC-2 type transporter-domain-containing protein [Paraphoma chrysanthemicola]
MVLAAFRPQTAGMNDERDYFSRTMLVNWLEATSGERRDVGAGLSFSNLTVEGIRQDGSIQPTCLTYPLTLFRWLRGSMSHDHSPVTILRDLEGCIAAGEMCLVLGRPGSGCSTFLKTIAQRLEGLQRSKESQLYHKSGREGSKIHDDCMYCAEDDLHFPDLNVTQTLDFAARSKPQESPLPTSSVKDNATMAAQTMVNCFSLDKCATTKVGNEIKRGISGGEKKRVSLAEAMLRRAKFQCWDSSTSGLDSATSSHFIESLRQATTIHRTITFAALYQVSKDTFNKFEKVLLLHEGRQIYFGSTQGALPYFERLGFTCPKSFTIADFLTALTHPHEVCTLREDCARGTPQSSAEFAVAWQKSQERSSLLEHISKVGGSDKVSCKGNSDVISRSIPKHPFYPTTFFTQLRTCLQRAVRRMRGSIGASISMAVGNLVLSIIIGTVFRDIPHNAETLLKRSILLFYIITINAFLFSAEVALLWEHRPIIEKHRRFAFHRPVAEAVSSIICDIPNKILASIAFNIPIYFLAGLRRSPRAFFTFYVFSFACLMTLSMFFRMAGSFSRSIVQTIVPVGVFLSICVIYSGFILPASAMLSWLAWIRYINPLYFALESVMINEFSDQHFPCYVLVPSGDAYNVGLRSTQRACSISPTKPGNYEVLGDEYIVQTFGFDATHLWRNLGILLIMMFGFCTAHLLASEYIRPPTPKGTVLQFSRNSKREHVDIEALSWSPPTFNTVTKVDEKPTMLEPELPALQWRNLGMSLRVGKTEKNIISDISGYIRKGEVTALMGSTGAGKTTLLNTLAHRAQGLVSGDIFHEGRKPSKSFQRLVGYAQQSDIHQPTATVREALMFSTQSRMPGVDATQAAHIADEVIGLTELAPCADAVIGMPGEGLNLEQRRRLTIAVELAAQPSGILFLDEPTSNLDGQTAWSICALLRRLAASGYAVLCTIHQPSGSLLELFDNLLLLDNGGKQLYFGHLGTKAEDVVRYFTNAGARQLSESENPAEWLLQITEKLHPSTSEVSSWADIWSTSDERAKLMADLKKASMAAEFRPDHVQDDSQGEFAIPFQKQYALLLRRTFQEFWRSPSYIWSKLGLCFGIALFVGISLWMSNPSLQSFQTQLFSLFLIFTIGNSGMKQIIYAFCSRRNLFEAREGPSKMYGKQVFVLASITAELPWQTLTAIPVFLLWYFPTGIYRNADGAERAERGALLFLLLWAFFLFMATFAVMVASGIKHAPIAANIAVVLYQLMLLFCGVLATPSTLPRFWIFMYRVSPLTYLVSSMMSASIAHTAVTCLPSETVKFDPPQNVSCGSYMAQYLRSHQGYLLDTESTTACQFCPWTTTNTYLAQLNIDPKYQWRDLGIFTCFIFVNVVLALGLYSLVGREKSKQKRASRRT